MEISILNNIFLLFKIHNKQRQPSFGPFSTEITTSTSAGILKDPFDSEWASMVGSGSNGQSDAKGQEEVTVGHEEVAVSTNPFFGDGFEDEDEVDQDEQRRVHVPQLVSVLSCSNGPFKE